MQENQLLDALTREGVLINVSVRYWRAQKKLTAEDLGLDPESVESRLISLGHKKLIPREALKNLALIESRAHTLVEASTFPFLNGLAHFLPNSKLEEVMAKLTGLEQEFKEEQHRFMGQYAEMRQAAAAEWLALAQKLVKDPEKLVAAVLESFPCQERMERAFGFSTQLFQITIPEGMTLSPVQVKDQMDVMQARENAARQAAAKISQGVEGFVADCVASMRGHKTGVHQKTLNRLVKFIDEFKQLNFVGDHQLEEELERVKRELLSRSAEEYRDSDGARQRLQDGLRNLANTAKEMAAQDSRELVERFGQLGVRKFHVEQVEENATQAKVA